jgi:hypothetical protein
MVYAPGALFGPKGSRRRWNAAPLVILFEDSAPHNLFLTDIRGGTIGFEGAERSAMMRLSDEAMGIRCEVAGQ